MVHFAKHGQEEVEKVTGYLRRRWATAYGLHTTSHHRGDRGRGGDGELPGEGDRPEGGERTFTAPLSPSGEEPATHYWCSWAVREDEDSSLYAKLAAAVAAGMRGVQRERADAGERAG